MKNNIFLWLCSGLLLLASCTKDDVVATPKTGEPTTTKQDDDKATITDTYTYQLPIIFHVFYQDATNMTQHVKAERLKTMVGYLNELYKGGVYGSSSAVNVNFQLAQKDEKGNLLSTPGVEYIQWTGEYPIDFQKFMSAKSNVQYLWEPNDYINIMVYPFKTDDGEQKSGTLGISHLPLMPKALTDSLEGLSRVDYTSLSKKNLSYPFCTSINSDYIYDESTRYTAADKGAKGYQFSSVDVNVTLAHELGHYLGLHHVFTENDTATLDSCADTDYCKDTPSYNRVEYEKQLKDYLATLNGQQFDLYKMLERQPCTGAPFRASNFMDYDLNLGFQFTDNQVKRMRTVLYYGLLIPGPKKPLNKVRGIIAPPEGVVNLPMKLRK
ncbi:zinc-dependent metalloproteinase lipoprotein, BF0631 family [Prevotella sp. DNF00663]|uniref:zinc-dependent metalloproteinase lipoprotein n=1 Tax=Prevotella sp. DNF00663 TaxID=1384078 RepID=UPI000782EE2B|nr:zinc-dependent metalloproteinase lipoprotein [Prevotella sp. DNF00663]KXB78814.1 zinc-dependent metalloproteinase lipoprotein, BF0631 family [Prevotella sp. DNF00663]